MADSAQTGAAVSKEEGAHPIAHAIDDFAKTMEAMFTTTPLLMLVIDRLKDVTRKDFECFRDEHGEIIEEGARQIIKFEFSADEAAGALLRRIDHVVRLGEITPKAMFMAMISQYDYYLSSLIKAIIKKKPELIEDSDRSLTFANLSGFCSLDEAKEHLIEKEVESVMRESHVKQFIWMERRFGVKLREGLSVWPEFVEMTERRNLFAHTDGYISSHYIANCIAHSCNIDGAKVGEKLGVGGKYYKRSYAVVFEVGFKLAHVLWRKQFPAERDEADRCLVQTCFDLLKAENYSLAKSLLEFSTGGVIKKWSSDRVKRMLLINLAIAEKAIENTAGVKRILGSEDWSACGADFELAVAVLRDDYDLSCKIMKRIGRNGSPSEYEYATWPLFKWFRETDEFKCAYFEIFDKKFQLVPGSEVGFSDAQDGAAAASSISPDTIDDASNMEINSDMASPGDEMSS